MPKKSGAGRVDRGGERRSRQLSYRLPCGWVLLVALAVVVVGSCVALDDQLLNAPFVLDDEVAVSSNAEIRYIGMSLMKRRIGSEVYSMSYNDPSRPLVSLTFQLNYAYGGLNPQSFRVCNIVLHWVNAFLVFLLADALYAAAGLPTSTDGLGVRLSALLAALLFLASPMNHSTAVYVFARSDIMGATGSLTFTVLGLRAFLSREHFSSFSPRAAWMALVLTCSLFSKQLAVTAPVGLGFAHLVLFPLRASEDGEPCVRHFVYSLGRSLKVNLLWVCVLAAYLGFRKAFFGSIGDVQGRLPMTMVELPWPWWCYQLLQPYALLRYLRTMMVPLGIAIDHHILEYDYCMASFAIYCSIIVVVLFAALGFSLIVRIHVRGPIESFFITCVGWFGIHLLPTHVVKTTDVYCERRAYLSSAGVYAAIVMVPFALLSRQSESHSSVSPANGRAKPAHSGGRALHAAAAALLACFVAVSRQLNPVYYTGESLWREVVRQYPESVRGRNNLGTSLITKLKSGDVCPGCEEEVRSLFGALLEYNHLDYDAMMNLGDLERDMGNDLPSRQWYEKVISIAPNHAIAHFKLATNLHRIQGAPYDKILGHYLTAMDLAPTIQDLHNNLALLYVHTGQGRRARQVWAEGIAIHPGNDMLLKNRHVVEMAP